MGRKAIVQLENIIQPFRGCLLFSRLKASLEPHHKDLPKFSSSFLCPKSMAAVCLVYSREIVLVISISNNIFQLASCFSGEHFLTAIHIVDFGHQLIQWISLISASNTPALLQKYFTCLDTVGLWSLCSCDKAPKGSHKTNGVKRVSPYAGTPIPSFVICFCLSIMFRLVAIAVVQSLKCTCD